MKKLIFHSLFTFYFSRRAVINSAVLYLSVSIQYCYAWMTSETSPLLHQRCPNQSPGKLVAVWGLICTLMNVCQAQHLLYQAKTHKVTERICECTYTKSEFPLRTLLSGNSEEHVECVLLLLLSLQ